MIPFAFDYYQPQTIKEAVDIYAALHDSGRAPVYFAGGTEIITMARLNNLTFDAVIDIKQIPECRVLTKDTRIELGAALPLADIVQADVYHLLSLACARVADHTAQRKITLGGNIAGTIIYHESVLPLLVADGRAVVAGPAGEREVALRQVFEGTAALEKGEFYVQFAMPADAAGWPAAHAKHTESEKIGYPVLTAVAVKTQRAVRMAFSGIYENVFMLEHTLAEPMQAAADAIMAGIPMPLKTDAAASGQYRAYVLRETVQNILHTLEAS